MIEIDKNIPLPNHTTKYPFRELEVGDSFLAEKSRSSMGGVLTYWKKKLGHSYTTKVVVQDGLACTRIWRTK